MHLSFNFNTNNIRLINYNIVYIKFNKIKLNFITIILKEYYHYNNYKKYYNVLLQLKNTSSVIENRIQTYSFRFKETFIKLR